MADEQTLTEPLLQRIVERVLGFPADAYFPQLGKSRLKPDLTPNDLIAHSFVLDAKGTDESLSQHVAQIRGYVDQRSLRYGVLFNLRRSASIRAAGPSTIPRSPSSCFLSGRPLEATQSPAPRSRASSASCAGKRRGTSGGTTSRSG